MSPQSSLFGVKTPDFLRQIGALTRHFKERNLPANLLSYPESVWGVSSSRLFALLRTEAGSGSFEIHMLCEFFNIGNLAGWNCVELIEDFRSFSDT
jgi:hypothetical protein